MADESKWVDAPVQEQSPPTEGGRWSDVPDQAPADPTIARTWPNGIKGPLSLAMGYPHRMLMGLVDMATLPSRVASGETDVASPEGMEEALGLAFGIATGRLNRLPATGKTSGIMPESAKALREAGVPVEDTGPGINRAVGNALMEGATPGRSDLARTGSATATDSVLGSRVTRNAVDNPVVNRDHDVPYGAGGSVPLENPTVYIDRHFPKEITVGDVTFDPAEPFTVHENVEQHVMDILVKGGMADEEAYRVAHFEHAEKAEGAWYAAHGIDQAAAEEAYKPILDQIQHENPANPPPDLYKRPYPRENVAAARHEHIAEAKPTPEEIAKADEILKQAGFGGPRITGGLSDAPDLAIARDLGVIGDPLVSSEVKTIEAYHGSPYSFDVFSTDKIGTGEGAQSYGHGLYFAENEAVAEIYARNLSAQRPIPHSVTAALKRMDNLGYDRAGEAMKDIRAEGKDGRDWKATWDIAGRSEYEADAKIIDAYLAEDAPAPNKYQVRIHADREHFLDWDKPLSEQSPEVQAALKSLGVKGNATGQDIILQLGGRLGGDGVLTPREAVSAALRDAGIPGIKYLDQGSRVTPTEITTLRNEVKLYESKLADPKLTASHRELTQEQLGSAKQELAEAEAGTAKPTSNFVVFDARDVEITHKNGVPVEKQGPPDLRPPRAAEAKVAEEKVGTVLDKAGNLRPEILPLTEDTRALMYKVAEEQGGTEAFREARSGDVPLAHYEPLSEAFGVPVEDIHANRRGLGRLMKNDHEVRAAVKIMDTLNDKVMDAMRRASLVRTPEALMELERARQQFVLGQEQLSGLAAEAGRTLRVFKEMKDQVTNAETFGEFMKNNGGASMEDLQGLADKGSKLNSRGQLAALVQSTRAKTWWDSAMYVWKNWLISGPVTHAKYVGANAAFMVKETLLDTPVAAAIGLLRRDPERVYFGEMVARMVGITSAVPDAIFAAAEAVRTGVPTQLPRQVTLNMVNPYTQMAATVGKTANVLTLGGLPGRGVSMIHTFFNFLGHGAEIEALAYRQAAKEGLSPLTSNFWSRQSDLVMFPPEAMLDKAVEAGARANFGQPLGPMGKQVQNILRRTKVGEVVFPFTTIPTNIFKATQEGTPLAFLNAEMRDNLLGRNGAAASNTAWARMVTGSAIMATFANWALNDMATGDGPIDPKARAQWLLTHQPNSIRTEENGVEVWKSHDRFGPVGDLVRIGANLAEVASAAKEGEYAEAAGHVVVAAGKWVFETTGTQGIEDLVHAVTDPARYAKHYAMNLGTSTMPFSSGMSQTAAMFDPNLRVVHDFYDAMKYKVPSLRETLLPQRDWLGRVKANPLYSGDTLHTVRTLPVNYDKIDLELDALDIKPTLVSKKISGVELTPGQYEEYQVTAGVMTQQLLSPMVNSDNWQNVAPAARKDTILGIIRSTRKAASDIMQARHPELIQQAVQDKVNHLTASDLRNKKLGARTPREPNTDVDPQGEPE